MGFLHRKILQKSTEAIAVIKLPCPSDHCDHEVNITVPRTTQLLPPPPPPTSNQSLSPFLIFMFCGLAVSLSFICFFTYSLRYRRRQRSHGITNQESHEDFVNEDLGPVIHHPIWLINTVGLDRSQIESIHVFKYKKDENLIEGADCSVCLSEFEEDESLRLLPKCSHAFHVPCIDTWLRSHKNCPLCRAPIFKNTNDQTDHALTESNSIELSSASEEVETQVDDSETIDDHHVVEVENNGEIAKSSGIVDDHHVQGEELVAMRRSCSSSQLVVSKNPSSVRKSEHKLKGSSSNVHIRHKVMKSSSFGRSLRKASSFSSKSRPHNRSY